MIDTNRTVNTKCLKCGLELPNPEETGDAYNHVSETGHPVNFLCDLLDSKCQTKFSKKGGMITTKQLVMYRGKSK